MSASSKKKLRKEQQTALLTEKQLNERKEAKKLKIYSITFIVVVALVITIGLGILVSGWIRTSGIGERNTVALTVGDHEISGAEMSYFYMDTINATYNNWYNNYGSYFASYLSIMGLDVTKPLNEQIYSETENKTWADYFTDQAVNEAVRVYAMYDLAVAAGHKLTEEEIANVDAAVATMQGYADENNYPSLKDYLKAYYGNGSTEDSYRNYLETVALASSYESAYYDSLTYTQEQLETYSNEHYIDFSSFTYNTFQLNHNDFIDEFCTAEEGDTEHTHSEEEKAAALKAAKEAAEALIAGNYATVAEFDAAIKAMKPYSDSENIASSPVSAQLHQNVSNADIADWLADSSRKAGDMTIINNSTTSTAEDGTTTENVYAYTVVFFQERNDNNMKLVNVRHILKSYTAVPDTNGNSVYTEENKAVTKEAIETLLESWKSGKATEDTFATLATANSEDGGSKNNGGLYTDVYPGQMVTAFNDWCFDPVRQVGDYGIVETEYGCHMMYFSGFGEKTYRNFMVENTMRNNDYNAWYAATIEAAGHTVEDLSMLKLDLVLARN